MKSPHTFPTPNQSNSDMQPILTTSFTTSTEEQLKYAALLNTNNAVEGLICSGKSTFLEKADAYFCNLNIKSHNLLEQPSKPYLELFYSDMNRYAFSFQMDMLRQRQRCNEISTDIITKSGSASIVWNDRSMIGDPVFFMLQCEKNNITKQEREVYLDTFKKMGPYRYDRVLFFDVEASEAHKRSKVRNEKTGDPEIPLAYLEELRCAYYRQMRALALSGQARIIYVYNMPFQTIPDVLEKMLDGPSNEKTKEIFMLSPDLNASATEQDVSQAFGVIRKAYDEFFTA